MFEGPGLWAARGDWPSPPPNYVFLLQAVVLYAREVFGLDWSTRFVPADDPQRFQRVITAIAEACEAKLLRSWYRRATGELARMKAPDWRWTSPQLPKAWQIFFHSGQLLENDLGQVVERHTFPTVPLVGLLNVCPIFFQSGELNRFIRDASAPAQGVPEVQSEPPAPKRRTRRRGPDRFGESDRTLFPQMTELMKTEHLSAEEAAGRLGDLGKIKGRGGPYSRKRRLARRYREEVERKEAKN
jgi:hypothetical protein